jgi:acyl dehydratase
MSAPQRTSKPTVEPDAEALGERLDLWFLEDFQVGQAFELGTTSISEAQIIEFASRYDPQDFHVNPVLARKSPYRGLIASGWHTVSALTRLWVDSVLGRTAGLGSPGLDEIRFFAPVRPGDRLTGRATVTGCRPSDRREWRGTMTAFVDTVNQDDVVVAHFIARTLVARRAWVHSHITGEPAG